MSDGRGTSGPYIGRLNRELHRGLVIELEITLQVAALLASDNTAAEIREVLGLDKIEYEMCIRRLQRISQIFRG
jgi:hypothetical protein